jgi:hypothetical protein
VGFTLVGYFALGAGYGAGEFLASGVVLVSLVASLMAVVSFARKEPWSVLALLIALAPSLFLGAKFVEKLNYDHEYDRRLAEGTPYVEVEKPMFAPPARPLDENE